MRLDNEAPGPGAATDRFETFGGAYHLLESTFRTAEKSPSLAARPKHPNRQKPAPIRVPAKAGSPRASRKAP